MPNAEDLEIRAATPDDADAIAALLNLPGVRAGTMRLPFTTAALVRERLERTPRANRVIVGALGGEIVAEGGLMVLDGRQSHCGAIMLVVHDGYWGGGIGRKMAEALIDVADNWLGLRRLELEVYTDNMRAIALYESLGFEKEGRARGATIRDGVLIDHFHMARLRPALERRDEPD